MAVYLNIQQLVCGYNLGFQLKGIDLKIEKGAFAGIIGPNGSGKSTLFKAISGDLNIQSGLIEMNNKKLSSFSLREKALKMAVVSQFNEVLDVTVEDYVLMGRMPYRRNFQFFETKEDLIIARKYMRLTNVYQYKDHLMTELSGGEQQLAAIARALTQEPELLLLDEPTAHLDISHQVQILNLIQHLNEEMGLTVLIIIHDLNMAGEYCNHLVMMNDGNIHQHGNPHEVLTYQNIETVYNTVVIVRENPVSGKPVVFPVSEKTFKKTTNTSS
ncbi:MAG: ABC transporter ATP-binding protein [Prolixibacteraceae bacterium]|nr:ABC transporter ATP-binding protein [Prolixibacteraceae bacterium]